MLPNTISNFLLFLNFTKVHVKFHFEFKCLFFSVIVSSSLSNIFKKCLFSIAFMYSPFLHNVLYATWYPEYKFSFPCFYWMFMQDNSVLNRTSSIQNSTTEFLYAFSSDTWWSFENYYNFYERISKTFACIVFKKGNYF